jgi:sialidase-1
MRKTFYYVSLALCFGLNAITNAQIADNTLKYLVSSKGLSKMGVVFEPGLKIGNVTVRKTFQPSFVVTSKGTLLVFCQGRLFAGADNDPKVILMNKSYDRGATWEGVEVLSSPRNFFAISPYTSVINGKEKISFLTCVGLKVTKQYYKHDYEAIKEATGIDIDEIGNKKAAVLCKYSSEDDGNTWKMKFLTGDETPLYKKYDGYTSVFLNTIGQVHKIKEGKYKNRMILAAPIYSVAEADTITDNFRNHKCTGSGILFSDDDGETWQMEGMITDHLANEASAVSINNGSNILMIRRMNKPDTNVDSLSSLKIRPGKEERMAHISHDGGKTWASPFFIKMSDIMCHGTLANVNERLYFSIPAGIEGNNIAKKNWDDDRVRGAIYFSDDNGETWKFKIVEEGYYSYSTVGKIGDNYLITLFSRGGHGRFGIGYRIFTDDWLAN